jgi:hypothetical protein
MLRLWTLLLAIGNRAQLASIEALDREMQIVDKWSTEDVGIHHNIGTWGY